MRELVSVIVPVYNVEKYLKRCLESIINQTYRELEIILVDDGSKDESGKICEQYGKIDKRIKIIHKENGGLSSARNVGLADAKGKYISFVDSDDWIAKDMYEYMVGLIEKNEAEAVQCNFIQTNGSKVIINEPEDIHIYTNKDICQFYMEFSTKTGSYSVWKFLYKKEVLKDIKFREGKINEDIDYNYKVLARCKKIIVSNQVKYFYYQEGISLSTGGLKKRDFDLYDAAEALYQLAGNEKYGTISKLAAVKKARTPLSLLCKIAYYGIDDDINKKELVKKLRLELKQNIVILMQSPIPMSRKILAISFLINYRKTEFVIKKVSKIR